MTHTEFAEIVKAWRKDKARLTQVQAANYIGVGYSTYCQWEQGVRMPNHPDLILRVIGHTNNKDTAQ